MKLIVLTVALFIGFNSFSQDFSFGFKLAPTLNFNKSIRNNDYQSNVTNGYNIGIVLESQFNYNFGFLIEPTANFGSIEYVDKPIDYATKLNFKDNILAFDLPMIFRYQAGGKLRFLVDAGITYQFITKFDQDVNTKDNFTPLTNAETYKAPIGVTYGIGMSSNIDKSTKWVVSLRNTVRQNATNFSSNQPSLNICYLFR